MVIAKKKFDVRHIIVYPLMVVVDW